MKKILLLLTLITLISLSLNGCRYVNTQEAYKNAKTSPELTIPESVDKPNASSTLDVPKSSSGAVASDKKSRTPPDMPIRTKQTESGDLRIENSNGLPLLIVKADKKQVWQSMNSIELENWTLTNSDESSCVVNLHYNDQAARDRENAGFIKKLFSRESNYLDLAGDYQLSCEQSGSVMKVKFAKQDDTAAKTFLADSVMNKLYAKFE